MSCVVSAEQRTEHWDGTHVALHEACAASSVGQGSLNFAFTQHNVLDLLERLNPFNSGRTRAEIEELKRSIALIARVFSRNYNLEVLPAPDGVWACSTDPRYYQEIKDYISGKKQSIDEVPQEAFRPKIILYGEEDLHAKPEDEVMGVLRHEVGHANNTDYRLFFRGQRLARDEGYLASAWAQIQNALEDPWVNNIEISGSEAVRQKISAYYSRRIPEINVKIGGLPATHQLGLNIIHYWLTGENVPNLKNRDVLQVFEMIRPAADDYFSGKSATANFNTLRERIWPHYKTLEVKALEDEELKEFTRRLTDSKLGGIEQESKSEVPEPGVEAMLGASAKPGALSRTWHKIKRLFGFAREESAAQPPSTPIPPHQAQPDTGNLDQKLSQQGSDKLRQDLRQELLRQEQELVMAERELEDKKHESGRFGRDINLDCMPAPLRNEVEGAWRTLPSELKKFLEKLARQNLDRKHVEFLKQEGSPVLFAERDEERGEHIITPRALRPADLALARRAGEQITKDIEEKERADIEAKAVQEAQEAREREVHQQYLRETQEMRSSGFQDHERPLYENFKRLEDAMRQRIAAFIKILDQYLPKKEHLVQGGEHYSGGKLNQQSVVRRAPIGDYRVFKRPQVALSHEPRVFVKLLIDNSGSMAGAKMEESLKTAIFWGRVLKTFNIPFSISFFGDRVVDIKKFSTDYDEAKHRVKPELMLRSDASGNWTDMGTPLAQIKDEMAVAKRHYPEFHGAIFVISDSGANSGLNGEKLRELISGMQKSYTVMNFLLGNNQGEIEQGKKLFGDSNVIAPKDFHELPDESFRVLRFTLERILRIYQPRR